MRNRFGYYWKMDYPYKLKWLDITEEILGKKNSRTLGKLARVERVVRWGIV